MSKSSWMRTDPKVKLEKKDWKPCSVVAQRVDACRSAHSVLKVMCAKDMDIFELKSSAC